MSGFTTSVSENRCKDNGLYMKIKPVLAFNSIRNDDI